jgi:nitrogen fixation protein
VSAETDQVTAYIPKKETEEFVLVASKETGLAVYAEKT